MFSHVTLMGNLTRDVEVRYIPSGTAVAELTVAVNRKFKDTEEVAFVDVTVWGRTAELCGEYLSKGRQVLVSGRLKQDSWEDKDTGAKRSKLVVVAEEVKFIGSANGGGAEAKRETVPASSSVDVDNEEVPF